MTPHSPSRGIMYSEPPGTEAPADETETAETKRAAKDAGERDAIDPVEADANWTGEALADD